MEDRTFKLGQGEAVVYPADTLHRVESVTEGVRLAITGWATNWVRDPRQRDILFDLWQALRRAEAAGDGKTGAARFQNALEPSADAGRMTRAGGSV
ncbi:hypothetical protein [Marimonas arenosa]|uniref:Uncharacterized protein n=1 Tax=Marimonas arenosa TaxID=1795305 RepID=A0AAE4B7K1_9RHOB|nr:hypothetical protein [Marimonas arenosa]MDQ2091611.1 hypothetical protein [Marimonas arenosa]